ncbi:response regulator transcription factor [Chitinimonas koreensis]|uniref:response regulator transcription factor n=1 Tax=Chitinimonas koreensis TaxID=356302 RepID=UPI00040E6FBA|nr:response regulator [Chitinimonas koreensis]QNM94690.1 response regulator transcription factor [Chitinimonas koreensis]
MNATKPVYLVDDDAAVRDALGLLLLSHGYTVRAFDSGEAFLAAIDARSEGVAVLDVRMTGLSGLDVFDRLRADDSELIVLFLSGHGDIPMAVQAVKQGAFDFLEKPCGDQQLLDKIDDALAIAQARSQSRGGQQAVQSRLATLSPREREVMQLVLAGKLNKQVADELNIAIRTVEVHRANVFAKMGVRSALDLAQLLAGR